ncbi:MAG: hypothetical protein ACOY3P_10340 [Planctomycetota bacterium]
MLDVGAETGRRGVVDLAVEDNAAVPWIQAIGPHEGLGPSWSENLRALDAPEPEPSGPYLVDFETFLIEYAAANGWNRVRTDEARRCHERCLTAPWKPDECPLTDAWLLANRRPLERIREAARRSRFRFPIPASAVRWGESLPFGVPMKAARASLEVLAARAMAELGARRPEEAWNELHAAFRLARLTAQMPLLLDQVLSSAYEAIALGPLAAMLGSRLCDAVLLRRIASDLDHLPEVPAIADVVDKGERVCELALVDQAVRLGPAAFPDPSGDDFSPLAAAIDAGPLFDCRCFGRAILAERTIDWDEVRRRINADCDRVVATLRLPTYVERCLAAVNSSFDSFSTLRKAIGCSSWDRIDIASMSDTEVVEYLIAWAFGSNRNVQPIVVGSAICQARRALARVAAAVELFRAETGTFPENLQPLVPDFLPATPIDPFTDRPLLYYSWEHGFTVYSVGRNGRDDGGQSHSDLPDDAEIDWSEAPDDIALRVEAAGG